MNGMKNKLREFARSLKVDTEATCATLSDQVFFLNLYIFIYTS